MGSNDESLPEAVALCKPLVAAPADVVAREEDEIRLRAVRGVDRGADVRNGREGPDVDVRELGDAHAVVARIEPGDTNLVLGHARGNDHGHAAHCGAVRHPWQLAQNLRGCAALCATGPGLAA